MQKTNELNASSQHVALAERVEAWLANELSQEEAETERARLRSDEAWKAAYRAVFASHLSDVPVPPGDPALDVDPSAPFWVVAVPHMTPGDAVEAALVVHDETWGLEVRSPWAKPRRAPWGVDRIELPGDAVTGTISVSLAWSKPDALDEAFRARVAAKALAANEIGDQAVRRRLLGAIRSALLAPELTTELESAVRSFSKGVDPSEREQRAAEIVYAARLELDEAAANDALAAETAALLDDEFDSFADALFTIDDDRYREITGDRLLDPDRFWGARARLDESVPEEVVLGALRDREQGNQLRVGDGGAVVRLLRQPLEFPIQLAAAADSGKASQVTRVGWHGSDVSAYARPEPGPHLRLRVLEPKDAATVELAGLIRPVQDGWARFEVDLLRALWETSELELTVTAQDGRVLRAAFDA